MYNLSHQLLLEMSLMQRKILSQNLKVEQLTKCSGHFFQVTSYCLFCSWKVAVCMVYFEFVLSWQCQSWCEVWPPSSPC